MQLTVIISYYKALDNLKLILDALQGQSKMDFEVIISEDDNNLSTIEFLKDCRKRYKFQIMHIHQNKDDGFRKNEMLNRAILLARAEKLAFIDGDCIPHHHFVKSYIREIKPGYIFDGRAVMLGKKITEDIKLSRSIKNLNLISILISDADKKKDGIYFPFFPLSIKNKGRGLVGRNWGITKLALTDINGFDMDYIHAGVGEDVDIEWRLKANGMRSKSMKNKAIVYHLYHEQVYSEDVVRMNFDLMYQKQKEHHIRCINGLDKISLSV